MEHYPFLTYSDMTEVTYSDIKEKDGKEYVTIYFETPSDDKYGFHSTQINYPIGDFEKIIGYSDEQMEFFRDIVNRCGEDVLQFAREDSDASNR